VVLVRTEGLFGLTVSDAQVFAVAPADAPSADRQSWEPAVAALVSALASFARRGESLTVVLSNHFCHYTVLPALPSLANREEDEAYARHTFGEIYGDLANSWTLRVSGDSPAEPRVAGAIDHALLRALQATARNAGVRLSSVQPLLMAAFNAFADRLAGESVWFVVQEPGRICVSLSTRGSLRSVRGSPAGTHWASALPRLIERETQLQEPDGAEAATATFVFQAGAQAAGVPGVGEQPTSGAGSTDSNWSGRITPLRLPELPLPPAGRVQELAMALVGAS
jgi:hypothetical protein